MATITVSTRKCIHCGETGTVDVDEERYKMWCDADDDDPNRHIQYAMPEMTADNREQLITGTHPKCWTEMFGDNDE